MMSLKKKVLISIPLSLSWFFQKIERFCINHNSTKVTKKKLKKDQNLTTNKKLTQSILADNKLSYVDYINELNKTEVYLIVRKSKRRNNLLLIHSQEQLSATKSGKPRRFRTIFLKGRQENYHREGWYDPKTKEVSRGFKIKHMAQNSIDIKNLRQKQAFEWDQKQLMARKLKNEKLKKQNEKERVDRIVDLTFDEFRLGSPDSPLHEYFRGGKFYFPNNLGGCKSISPVFFDQEAAKIFLTNVCEESINVLRNLPIFTKFQISAKKQLLKNILDTKIISIGLGDLLEFYSSSSNEDALEKTEFLFFPAYENLNKKLNTKKSTGTFRLYQQKLFAHKSKSE